MSVVLVTRSRLINGVNHSTAGCPDSLPLASGNRTAIILIAAIRHCVTSAFFRSDFRLSKYHFSFQSL